MRLGESEEDFDARLEEYVEQDVEEAGIVHAIKEERHENL